MRRFLALILLMLQHFILTTEFWYSILQKGLLSNAVCRFEFSYLMFPTVYKSFQISSFSCERLQYKSLVVCLQWLHCGSFHSHLQWQMQMIMQCFPVSFMYFCRRLMTKFNHNITDKLPIFTKSGKCRFCKEMRADLQNPNPHYSNLLKTHATQVGCHNMLHVLKHDIQPIKKEIDIQPRSKSIQVCGLVANQGLCSNFIYHSSPTEKNLQ